MRSSTGFHDAAEVRKLSSPSRSSAHNLDSHDASLAYSISEPERSEGLSDADMSVATAPASFDAEHADNFEEIEKQFAVKAVQQLEIHWKMLSLRKGTEMRFTKMDDAIYDHLVREFPEFGTKEGTAKELDEDEIKSKAGKAKWREFMMTYKDTVEDYNFGSMLRKRADEEYTQDNTIFAPRMQFLAIEIARNRFGLNDWVCKRGDS